MIGGTFERIDIICDKTSFRKVYSHLLASYFAADTPSIDLCSMYNSTWC